MPEIRTLGKDMIAKCIQTLELLEHNVDNIIKQYTLRGVCNPTKGSYATAHHSSAALAALRSTDRSKTFPVIWVYIARTSWTVVSKCVVAS